MGDDPNLASALAGLTFSSRKPELPNFDKRDVVVWTRRVENAFIRSNVTQARDKFAYIESKFGLGPDADPNIHEYLFGEPTDENWTGFMSYLKTTYGKSMRDKTAAILDPTERNGRRPSQVLANIKSRMENVTLDDLKKERILRILPNDIRLTIASQVESLNADETAKIADKYFTLEGQPIFKHVPAVNAVYPPPQMTAPFQDETDINAIRNGARQKPKQERGGNRDARSKSRPRTNGAGYVHQNPDYCYFHDRYAAKARNCQPGCKWKSPNEQGPRRA